MLSHEKSGVPTFITDMYKLPMSRAGWGASKDAALTDLLAAAPTNWWCYDKTGAKIGRLDFIWEMEAQSLCYMWGWSAFKAPSFNSSGKALFKSFFADMKNALLELTPNALQYDLSTAATTLAQMLQGLADKDGGSSDKIIAHRQWFRRWIIAIGHVWAKLLPRFNERWENQDATQVNRVVYTFLAAAIDIISDFFAIAFQQSDRTMFNLTFLDVAYADKKIPTNLQTAVNAWLLHFVTRSKNPISATFSKYTQYTDAFLDISAIASTSDTRMVDTIQKMSVKKSSASDLALKLARQMFGVGINKSEGDENNFIVILDAYNGLNTSTTPDTVAPLSTNHGTTKYCLGYNMVIGHLYFEDIDDFREKTWKLALKNRRHWSFDDLEPWFKTLYTPYSFFDSITGLAEDASWKGFRQMTQYSTIGAYYTDSWFSDLMAVVSTNDLKIDALAKVDAGGYTRPASFWVYPFLMQSNLVDRRIRIFCYHTWSEQELIFALRWGMLLGREYNSLEGGYGQPTDGDQYRIWATAICLGEVVNCFTKNIEGLIYAQAGEYTSAIRFGLIGSVLDPDFNTEAIKYLMTCQLNSRNVDLKSSDARPKGLDDFSPTLIKNMASNYHNAQQWLANMFAPPSVGKVEKKDFATPKSKDVPAPTVPAPSSPAKTAEDDDS